MSLKRELRDFLDLTDTVGAGDSVQDAHDDGVDHIQLAPDYDPSVETYPIEIDMTDDDERTCRIEGVGPALTTLGTEELDTPVLDIQGRGSRSYNEAPTIANLSIEGGSPALRLAGTPFASVSNCYLSATGHGVVLDEAENGGGCFGVSFWNTQTWGCGGDGYRLEERGSTHATNWYGCHATANGGVGFRLRGASNSIIGGVSQLNHGYGITAREAPSTTVSGVYIEGNARRKVYPVELYARESHGLTVENSYFHAATPRDVWHDHDDVMRGVNVHDSPGVSVRDCVVRKYGDAFTAFFECDDPRPDIFDTTHAVVDDTDLLSTAGMDDVLSHGRPWPAETAE